MIPHTEKRIIKAWSEATNSSLLSTEEALKRLHAFTQTPEFKEYYRFWRGIYDSPEINRLRRLIHE